MKGPSEARRQAEVMGEGNREKAGVADSSANLEVPDRGSMSLLLSLLSSGSLYPHQKFSAVGMSPAFPMVALHLT